MKRKNKQANKWQANEDKAIAMTDKFIAVIEKLDCYNNFESIMIERIIHNKIVNNGLSSRIDYTDIVDMLESNFGFRILKGNSLAEDMKIEDFVSQIRENPYQLKLIA